jgi:hypothetical protein
MSAITNFTDNLSNNLCEETRIVNELRMESGNDGADQPKDIQYKPFIDHYLVYSLLF